MNLLENKEIKPGQWEDLLQNSGFASPFQSPEFFNLIVAVPGFSAEVFATEDNGILQALMLVVIQKEKGFKAFFSRRGIVYGGPLIRNQNSESFGLLIQSVAKKLKCKLIYIETRNFFDYQKLGGAYKSDGWRFIPYLNFQITTRGRSVDNVLTAMKYNRRREIKLGVKNGADYGISNQETEAFAVYSILKDLYDTRVKLPLPDFDFFRGFLHSDIAKFFVVKYEGKVIAGSFCLFLPGKNLFTMYYCGERVINNRIFPTSLAIYAAIEFAVQQKVEIVDMMGAGKPNEEYGVRDYKSQFGGDLVAFGRYLKVLNPLLYRVGKVGLKILSKF
jgi:serine/alanine adding enzyme